MPFQLARDPVSLPILRRWCDAMGVDSLVHLDPEFATRSCFGRVVAPLTMLDVWTKPGLAYERDVSGPQGGAFEILDGAGFTSAMAVSSELAQERPLVIGDLVRSTLELESVSPEKSTAVGPAHFVTTRQDFFADDELVGHARLHRDEVQSEAGVRVATASPRTRHRVTEPRAADRRGRVRRRDELGTLMARQLSVGRRMPSVDVPITTTLIVSGALMTSDYFEPHHDRDAAVQRGSRDVFMNIHTSLGLVEGFVGAWLGPNARWKSIATRLGTPNHPGDCMVIEAEVADIDVDTGATSIAFRATNGLGMHAQGSIAVVLPS